MNKFWQHPELLNTFLVGNHSHIFLGRFSNEMQPTLIKHYQKFIKKGGHEMDFYPAMCVKPS